MTFYVDERGVLVIPPSASDWDAVRSVLDAVADYGLRGFMVEDQRPREAAKP